LRVLLAEDNIVNQARLFDAVRAPERIGAEGGLGAVDAAWRHMSIQASFVTGALCRFESKMPLKGSNARPDC
jgi:hypothetical protein